MLTGFSRLKRMDSVVNGVMDLLIKATHSTSNDADLIARGKVLTGAIPAAVRSHQTPSTLAFEATVAQFDPHDLKRMAKNDAVKCR